MYREPEARIDDAIFLAIKYGGCEGAHHKAWLIDRIVRVLAADSVEYENIVSRARMGEDGPNTYDWDVGIAP